MLLCFAEATALGGYHAKKLGDGSGDSNGQADGSSLAVGSACSPCLSPALGDFTHKPQVVANNHCLGCWTASQNRFRRARV